MTNRLDPNDEIMRLIGEATVAWNDIEHAWFRIFLVLLQAPQGNAKAVYYSVQNSGTQRTMIGALAKKLLWDHETICDKMVSLLSKTGNKSAWRNGFVHGFYGLDVYVDNDGTAGTTPLMIIEGGKNRLLGKDLSTELTRLKAEFSHLAGQVWDLYGDISDLPAGALRDKPGPL